MSLRARLTLAAGTAVFVALAIASLVIFISVRSKLHDQIDVSLIQTAQNAATKIEVAGATGKLPAGTYARNSNPNYPAGPFLVSDASGYFQIIPSVGAIAKSAATTRSKSPLVATTTSSVAKPDSSTTSESNVRPGTQTSPSPTATQGKVVLPAVSLRPNRFVPLTPLDDDVAAGLAAPYFRETTYRGTALRLYTMRLSPTGDGLVRSARPLTEANATVGRVRWLLIALTLGGAAAAALLGRLAAAAVMRPVHGLAGAVREVTTTRDLGQRIPVRRRDEVASLGESFNEMLSALEESQRVQQQLIADASHELRTPLTAHRANVELLARPDLPLGRRPSVLAAAVRGIEELSALVNDLIGAARDGTSVDARTPVALDELVDRVLARAAHRSPGTRFVSRVEPCSIFAARARVERAIDNVIDNAVKWGPKDATVDVTLERCVLTVRDHGPGIDAADLPHVFDRFYRATSARGLPGSGLGLAIVKRTLDDHGGSVRIANAEGGGVVVSLSFGLS